MAQSGVETPQDEYLGHVSVCKFWRSAEVDLVIDMRVLIGERVAAQTLMNGLPPDVPHKIEQKRFGFEQQRGVPLGIDLSLNAGDPPQIVGIGAPDAVQDARKRRMGT